jgi:predicted metal-dependent HD superfamily phosphohydrolase
MAWESLARGYGENGRFYHNLAHMENVLAAVVALAAPQQADTAVILAAYYHDWVYRPGAADNEAASARRAGRALAGMGAGVALIDEVGRLIRATAGHEGDGDRATQILLDADLAVLGAEPARYRRYARAIRLEYRRVPDVVYRTGRAGILRRFLEREWIYQTAAGRARWEAAARRNLAGELGEMEAAGGATS